MFITFEGTDGTGKTTQIELLRAFLVQAGREVVVTREPGGCPVAERVRELLLNKENVMDDWTEAYLYAAARAEHVRRVIRPALAAGKTVLCDRFVDSSAAYQGYGRGLGEETIRRLNERAVDGCMPDRTYLLTLSPEAAQARVTKRGEKDRMESAGDEFDHRVAAGFLNMAQRETRRFMVLDAARPVSEIAASIAKDVAKLQTGAGKREG